MPQIKLPSLMINVENFQNEEESLRRILLRLNLENLKYHPKVRNLKFLS